MNKVELLQDANTYAQKIDGDVVTERRLRDWVDEKLVPGPKAHGRQRGLSPDWVWPEESLTLVKQLVWLKKRGVWRNNSLMLHAWVYGVEYPHDRLREALRREHGRLLRRLRRKISLSREPQELWQLPDDRKEHERKKLGPADQQLTGLGITPSNDITLGIASMMETGNVQESDKQKLAGDIQSYVADALGCDVFDATLETLLCAELEGFEGIFGLRDETDQAVEDRINQYDECDLEYAKQRLLLTICSCRIIHKMGSSSLVAQYRFFSAQYGRVAASLVAGEFLVAWLVQGANSSYLARVRAEVGKP